MSSGIERLVQLTLDDDDLDLSYIQESLRKLPLGDEEPAHGSISNPFDLKQSLFLGSQATPTLSSSPFQDYADYPDYQDFHLAYQPVKQNGHASAHSSNGQLTSNISAQINGQIGARNIGQLNGNGNPLTGYGAGSNGANPHSHSSSLSSALLMSHSPVSQTNGQSQAQSFPPQFSAAGHPSFRPYKSVPPNGYVCKLCKVPGHWIQNCPDAALYPLVRDFNNPHRKITYPPEGYVCRLCGVPGHWIQNCPDAPKYPRPFDNGNPLTMRDSSPPEADKVLGTSPTHEAATGAKVGDFLNGMEESSTLWMGDLEPWMTEEVLTDYFSQFGEPAKVRIATFKYGIPAGYCYIYFSSPHTAQRIFQSLNGNLMENTNHVFRLKIANKNSRFFSRAQGKEIPFLSKGEFPEPTHYLDIPPPKAQSQTQGSFSFKSSDKFSPRDFSPKDFSPRDFSPRDFSSRDFPAARDFPREFTEQEMAGYFSGGPGAEEQIPYLDDPYSYQFEDFAEGRDPSEFGRFAGRAPSFSVFVGNLGLEIDRETLLSVFQKRYQSVIGGKVVFDPFTGVSKGYGFVIFGDEDEQNRALKEMQGQFCGERPMRINRAIRRS